MIWRTLGILAISTAATGCEPPAEEPPAATALPKAICDQAQEALNGATKTGGVVLNSPLEGVIAHEAWLQMPASSRDGLTQAMGVVATCAGGAPKLEQEVVIRSETGMVLTRRTVETSASMPEL